MRPIPAVLTWLAGVLLLECSVGAAAGLVMVARSQPIFVADTRSYRSTWYKTSLFHRTGRAAGVGYMDGVLRSAC